MKHKKEFKVDFSQKLSDIFAKYPIEQKEELIKIAEAVQPVYFSPNDIPPLKMYKVVKLKGEDKKEIGWGMTYFQAENMINAMHSRIRRIEEQYPGYHDNHELITYKIEEDK